MTQDNTAEPPPNPRKPPWAPAPERFRFGLSAIFIAIFCIALLLSRVTQFQHIVFVVFCSIASMTYGFWYQNYRLAVASLAASAMFFISYLACWVEYGANSGMYRPTYSRTRWQLREIGTLLDLHVKMKGKPPDSLNELPDVRRFYGDEEQVLDRWRHPYYYKVDGKDFTLGSLGADGKIGGVGFDADVFLNEDQNLAKPPLPLEHFLYQGIASRGVFLSALLASLATGAICYNHRLEQHTPTKFTIVGILVTIVAAIYVAVTLAMYHVEASQSGH